MRENRGVWYQAEYTSFLIIALSGLAIVLCVLRAFYSENFVAFWGLGLAFFLLMITFFSLRIVIDQNDVYLVYGVGIIKRGFPIFGIATVSIIRNERLSTFPYYPAGDRAIEVELRDGKKYRFPAERPKDLAEALSARAFR